MAGSPRTIFSRANSLSLRRRDSAGVRLKGNANSVRSPNQPRLLRREIDASALQRIIPPKPDARQRKHGNARYRYLPKNDGKRMYARTAETPFMCDNSR